MRKLLIIALLIVGCGFAIGERVNEVKYTIEKINTFSDITGWSKIKGEWKSKKNKIVLWDVIKDIEYTSGRNGLGNSNIIDISTYRIKQYPNLKIITFSYKGGKYLYPTLYVDWFYTYNMKVLVIEEKDLISKIEFKKNKLSIIDLPVTLLIDYDVVYSSSVGEFYTHLSLPPSEKEKINFIKSHLPGYFQPDKSHFQYDEVKRKRNLKICYYINNNTIQYMIGFGKKSLNSDFSQIDEYFESISGQYILIDDYNISSNPNMKEYMEYRYFESPFDKFSQFFDIKD